MSDDLVKKLEEALAHPVPSEGIVGAFYRQRRLLMAEVHERMMAERPLRKVDRRRKHAA